MPLEKWQRFLKAHPCEICRGWNSGKNEAKCKGFRHRDGTGVYCQQIKSPHELDVHGLKLYWHGNLYEATGASPEGESGDLGSATPNGASPSREAQVIEETVVYPQQGRWRSAKTEHWFVVVRNGQELTRSLKREIAELYLR